MKTILVLAQNPELPRTIRTILESEPHRLIHRPDIEEAEPLLKHGALDVCLLDADQPQVQALWVIERLQEFSPTLPVFVLTATRTPEWEEQLYTRGVAQVLSKPIRPRLLSTLINRLGSRNTSTPASSPASPPTPLPTAYDMVDGNITVTASRASGSVFPLGKTTVTGAVRPTDMGFPALQVAATGSYNSVVASEFPPLKPPMIKTLPLGSAAATCA